MLGTACMHSLDITAAVSIECSLLLNLFPPPLQVPRSRRFRRAWEMGVVSFAYITRGEWESAFWFREEGSGSALRFFPRPSNRSFS